MVHRGQIGEKVKEARKNKGYKQQKVSELTKINKAAISEIDMLYSISNIIGQEEKYRNIETIIGYKF